jgi:YegS/Rv2252/BmrU family lipid kinase
MRYLFIVNPKAGLNKGKRILRLLDKKNIKYPQHHIEICKTRYAGHAIELSAQAVKDHFDIVVAVGGDGTMNEVARSLVYSETSLGVLTAGSGNGFSRSLHMPKSPDKAIDVIFNPTFKTIDSGIVNDIHFFNIAGVGIDAFIAQRFQRLRARGFVSYLFTGIKAYFQYKIQTYTLIFDKEEIDSKYLLVAIANANEYGNGAKIAPNADFSDGLLDICTLDPLTPLEAIQNLKYLFNGEIHTISKYNSYRSETIRIESTESRLIVHADGEPQQVMCPLRVKVLPKSLKICYPSPSTQN